MRPLKIVTTEVDMSGILANTGSGNTTLIDSLVGLVIDNILQDLYAEPECLTLGDVASIYSELDVRYDNELLQAQLYNLLDIKREMCNTVIAECQGTNLLFAIKVLNKSLIKMVLYDSKDPENLSIALHHDLKHVRKIETYNKALTEEEINNL